MTNKVSNSAANYTQMVNDYYASSITQFNAEHNKPTIKDQELFKKIAESVPPLSGKIRDGIAIEEAIDPYDFAIKSAELEMKHSLKLRIPQGKLAVMSYKIFEDKEGNRSAEEKDLALKILKSCAITISKNGDNTRKFRDDNLKQALDILRVQDGISNDVFGTIIKGAFDDLDYKGKNTAVTPFAEKFLNNLGVDFENEKKPSVTLNIDHIAQMQGDGIFR